MLLQKGNRYRPLASLILEDKRQFSQDCLWYICGKIKPRRRQMSNQNEIFLAVALTLIKSEDGIPHTERSCLIKWDLFGGNEKISLSVLIGLLLYSTGANGELGICSRAHQNPMLALVQGDFGLGAFPLGQRSPLWRVEGGQKDRRMRCRSEMYASQNIADLNQDCMDLTSTWTCWIDNQTGLLIWDSDYELTPKMPLCSRQVCLWLAKHQCHW